PDPADAAAVHRSLAARADLVFAGFDEAELLTGLAGATADDLARAIAGLGPAEVVVKLGEDGAIAFADGAAHERAAVPVTVVDTVGAGDAFVAGYLAARLAGQDVDGRLALGVRTGAAACTHPGDWEGFPTHRDLERDLGADPVQR
ncbi:PfkB family carbohydrate kinase, partial [Agromyces binzhouensis]